MQVVPFYQEALKVLRSGPWDSNTFGVVNIHTTQEAGRLILNIDLLSENPIYFEIDCYYWQGSTLNIVTRGVVKWVFQALD